MEAIFSLLWKRKDIPEDFRTEILAWVLKHLQSQNLLNNFFNNLGVKIGKLKNPIISTQQIEKNNRFDILISDSDYIIIFENKWDSLTDLNQLQLYDKYLQGKPHKHKILIHITKDYNQIDEKKFLSRFYKIPWSHIYNSLSNIEDNEIIKQFLQFLEEEGVAMKNVSWEIINGAKSIYSLTRIIQRACEELNLKHEWKPCSSDYTAQCIDGKIMVYFIFKEAKLYFGVLSNINPSENLLEKKWSNYYCVDFNFDDKCFFHKNLEDQVEIIKEFIKSMQSLI